MIPLLNLSLLLRYNRSRTSIRSIASISSQLRVTHAVYRVSLQKYLAFHKYLCSATWISKGHPPHIVPTLKVNISLAHWMTATS